MGVTKKSINCKIDAMLQIKQRIQRTRHTSYPCVDEFVTPRRPSALECVVIHHEDDANCDVHHWIR